MSFEGRLLGISRDLVKLEEALRREGRVDLFAPIEGSGLRESPAASALSEHLHRVGFPEPERALRMCLQALRVQHEEMTGRLIDAELVATLPSGMPGIARTTDQVLLEMLRPPVEEVILLGYELTDLKLLHLLVEVEAAGADVIVICDRTRGTAERVQELGFRRPRVFQDRERLDGAPYASMHAKCLLVNGADLLVTSANFTFHGLHGNIEIGVRLSGPPASEARKMFSHLVENRIVEEVPLAP